MSIHDDQLHLASAAEMTSRDEREASLFDGYDDPAEMPASVIYAKRSIGVTGATPLALRLAAIADDEPQYGEIPAAALALIPLPADESRGAA